MTELCKRAIAAFYATENPALSDRQQQTAFEEYMSRHAPVYRNQTLWRDNIKAERDKINRSATWQLEKAKRGKKVFNG